RWGARAIVAGAVAYALSTGLLIAQVAVAGAALAPVQLIPLLIVVGAGQGLIMTPLLNLVLALVPAAQAGMASGVIATLQQIGAALGVAVVGMLFGAALAADAGAAGQAERYSAAFVAGMGYNFGAALAVCVLLWLLAAARPAR
ncbi:MAG: MFS transporter, partial [Comamonas sp.]